jgi:hypothetical protein
MIRKIIESLKNLIRAALDELYQCQKEDLFLRQYKGGDKK